MGSRLLPWFGKATRSPGFFPWLHSVTLYVPASALLWVSYGYKVAAVLRASQPCSGSSQEEEKRQRLHCLESRQEYLPQGLPPPSDWPELSEVVMLSGRAGRLDSLNGSVS